MDEKQALAEAAQASSNGENGENGATNSKGDTEIKTDALPSVAPHIVDISVRDLLVKVQPPRRSPLKARLSKDAEAQPSAKVILNNISIDIPGAALTAIMGSSGSGKTSLLNAMSKRVKGKILKQSGTIACIKNEAALVASGSSHDAGVAYVMQQDALQASLTVRETLRYAADLRLAGKMTKADRHAKVETVIADLGLTDCADTKIGDNVQRGCSGGEKRRTSIGIQLLADQPVLFLDEPSTGLDAFSAMGVVQCLKVLAEKGQTVVMTVHQPRSEIWEVVDNIVLLARGAVVYAGARSSCIDYFAKQGHSLPSFVNPFDFIIDVASIDVRTEASERTTAARVAALHEAWSVTSTQIIRSLPEWAGNLTPFDANAGSAIQATINWSHRMYVHTHRNWVTTIRDRLGLLAAIIEAIGMGIASGWIYFGLGEDLTGIRSRQGAFFACVSLQPYLIMLFETYRLTIDIAIFDRELAEGVTSAFTFILSRRFARLFLEDVPVPFIFSTIFYFMAGFRSDAGQFFTFFSLTLLVHLLSVMVAMFCVAANRHFMIASIIANAMFTVQSFGSGFVINTRTIAIWLRWIKWIAYSYYGYAAFSANEFAGHFYACPDGGPDNPQCIEYTGDYILHALDLPNDWLRVPIAALVGFLALMFVIDGLILHFKTHDIQLVRVNVEDTTLAENEVIEYTPNTVRPISVHLIAFGLSVISKRLFRKDVTKQILHPTTASFEPGVLNVIMGPSGSGKSSLLNAIANRLRTSTSSKYDRSGKVLLNGAVPSREVVKSVICYVPQDDVGLLPALTVRETLRYAARLRLPAWMSVEEKIRRAEDVLLKLGLKDCADTLVGNEMMKGISGGEKRRVTIALQILTEPRVLLLDEPT
jgi:ABC-type multidrug transport system ATPase subunit